ncbi:MAG: HEAT repeat domain-containing protein [Chitinophagaceae bacterium]|nr:HEAT repeat domain-containing protein [Chitinophagaceae bacterium]
MKKSLRLTGKACSYALFAQLLIVCVCLFSCKQKESSSGYQPQVPEGYTVEVAAGPGLVDYPMFSTLDETGRLFVFESTGNVYEHTSDAFKKPLFRIKLLEDKNGDGIYDKSTVFADTVRFPQGGVFYKGSLYASSAPDLLKLTDTDGDGVADKREIILSGWTLNVNANSLVGPFMGPDGWLYMTSAIMGFDVTSKEGQRMKGETSRIWRVKPNGSQLEWISAGGMNNPVELTFTPAGEIIGTETYFTDPKAGQRDALVYWTEGGVYPKPNTNIDRDRLPRTGELMPVIAKFSRVSPAGIARFRSNGLGEDHRGNLFSAQFNTHRIMRHKLFRDGASFKTEDEPFFTVSHEDFHPTDVLEDADGSMLVVETGGWFIKGCPLSQVSKPELKGSIYRVRKKGAPAVEDPYGNKIDWGAVSAEDAIRYLQDARCFVSDRAKQALIDMGEKALPLLKGLQGKTTGAEVVEKIIFTLCQVGSPEAVKQLRTFLDHSDESARIAAVRSLGLLRDIASVNTLNEMLLKDGSLPVKRQVATALGQINDRTSVKYLLSAAEKEQDRFNRHAIIYALILLNDAEAVRPALSHASPLVQDAALVALDQMQASVLQAGDIIRFLSGKNEMLRNTGLWIASHHPDWAGEMLLFLKKRFAEGEPGAGEEQLYKELLVSFAGQEKTQAFVADGLNTGSRKYQLFFLDVMAKSRMKDFPAGWIKAVGNRLLPETDMAVKTAAMNLVSMRELEQLVKETKQVADDQNNPDLLRMDAVSVLLKQDSILRPSDFSFLYSLIQPGKEAPLRQRAAHVMGEAQLTESQLQQITNEYLPRADDYMLPRIVPMYTGAYPVALAEKMIAVLQQSPSLDGFTESGLRKIFEKYPPAIKPAMDKLLAKLGEVHSGRLKKLQEYEDRIPEGSLERGRQLFFGKATCATCHTVGSQGGHMGPDLTSIQRDRSAHDLLEAIVYPGASFVREFETYNVKTNTTTYKGILKEKTPESVSIEIAPGNIVRVYRKDIHSIDADNVSMMPQGLDKLLTTQEMADLMAFLIGQDQDPDTDQKILRH